MNMKSRFLFRDIAVVLTACVSLTASLGCGPSMLAAIFVNQDNRGEVDMLRLVESPVGHLSGDLTPFFVQFGV